MGTCIICGADVEGHVCASHEEDVCFEFTGTRPEQLTPGRFYRGTVDGMADFGVFVDIGEHVTGLLHTSEIDRRLESLNWEPGDTVFVQVKNIRDNGNVDLGWSIRQHESEFRGKLVQTPDGDEPPEDTEVHSQAGDARQPEPEPRSPESPAGDPEEAAASEPDSESPPDATESTRGSERLNRTAIDTLSEEQGSVVRIEGRVVSVRQTSGPTVFEVRDESGRVECAAFEAAGVRAYPDVTVDDFVRIDGLVEERRGDIQVETEALDILEGEGRAVVEDRLESALDERARPAEVELLASHPGVEAVSDGIVAAATAIRRAVFDARPVVVRHNATVDGYVAGAALERAALGLIREEHEQTDAEYHYFDRRPLDGRVYDMGDAMRDTTSMLSAKARHDEKVPLFVFVDAGSTEESRDAVELLDAYGADAVVIDGARPDPSMTDAATAFVSPPDDDADAGRTVSATALAANVAAHVNPSVRSSLLHLPAVSYWRDLPEAYADIAAEAGYDRDAVRTLREAVALESFYQAYEDKRELIADLLFGKQELAAHASEQFRERVDREVRTARPHVEEWTVDGRRLGVLDVDAFTHHYEFPPVEVLLAELADAEGADALVGVDVDQLVVWSPDRIDMRAVADRIAEAVPDGGVDTRGGRDGYVVFLSGEREAVLAEAVTAVVEELA